MIPPTVHQRGVALVFVLCFLALISALVIAFFLSVTTELSSSKTYAGTVSTRELAESSVNLVMATIKDATSVTTDPASAKTITTTWASQPGMIRTYGTESDLSRPLTYYKLYSSDKMSLTSTGGKDNPAAFDPATDLDLAWDAKPALFTDLNAPVMVTVGQGSAAPRFPIIDPRAAVSANGYTPVEGFSYATGKVNGTVLAVSGDKTDNVSARLPMPVRWLYALKDGTLTAPDNTGNTTATWSGSPGAPSDTNPNPAPSASNPIVGRVAFWTDDESCKVNINTAAGDQNNSAVNDMGASPPDAGSFWGVPKLDTPFDRRLGYAQPCRYEFQRYPGHPATVALSAVFPQITRDNLLSIAPRISGVGSAGGSLDTVNPGGTLAAQIPCDADRLYASVDELMFKAPPFSSTPPQRDQNSGVTNTTIERDKFFLTASSRAPDLNLFGRPRICVWPESFYADDKHRTATDRLIAFTATVGANTSVPRPYYFSRQNANDATADYTGDPRNVALYQYLQTLTSLPIPGFGGPLNGFVGKYTSDRDQVLTEIFDYIRCVNLRDGVLSSTGGIPFTPATAISPSGPAYYPPTSGQVVPINIGTTHGFGRFNTVSEASLVFFTSKTARSLPAPLNAPLPTRMRVMLVFELFTPSLGIAGISPDFTLRFTENPAANPLVPANIALTAPNGNGGKVQTMAFYGIDAGINHYVYSGSRPWGGTEGIGSQFIGRGGTPFLSAAVPKTGDSGGGDIHKYFALITPSAGFDLGTNGSKPGAPFTFAGLKGFLEVRQGSSGPVVQTIPLTFPAGDFPIPDIPATSASDADLVFDQTNGGRMSWIQKPDQYLHTVSAQDTVRSLEPAGPPVPAGQLPLAPAGDMRLVAATTNVDANWFQPHARYTDKTKFHACSLKNGDGNPYATDGNKLPMDGSTFGNLVGASANYPAADVVHPDLPPTSITTGARIGQDAAKSIPGDWDTGMGEMFDGPYINKSDDGASSFSSAYGKTFPPYFNNTEDYNSLSQFSPNRQIASAVQFGSLSTGVARHLPWQTLLFRPDAAGSHPGSQTPKDHLLLDLFTMPVAEPYAISEPLSTAGRVNMNYRIAPFGYILRSTAVRAVLKATWMTAINTKDTLYKTSIASNNGIGKGGPYRFPVEPDEKTGTLKFFEDRFNLADSTNDPSRKGLFVSPSEICDVPLVPKGTDASVMNTYWDDKQLTGDNLREEPYNHIYPLLTTKSNTYTVHFKVQALKAPVTAAANVWDERKGQVLGEYRGSTMIERFVDPNDPRFSSLDPDNSSLASMYKFRVLSTKKFAP